MNAYELADELENKINLSENLFVFDAANMLRQQADLIRNLQKSLGFKNSGYETINLTPQTKPLSDEEILNLYKETGANNGGIREFVRAIEERHGIK